MKKNLIFFGNSAGNETPVRMINANKILKKTISAIKIQK